MTGLDQHNIKVVIYDSDFYALQALNSYCAWDRRTRVTFITETLSQLWEYLEDAVLAELPDVVVIDADHLGYADEVMGTITRIRDLVPDVVVFCLSQKFNPAFVEAAANAGARAFMLKHDVRLQITWAIVYTLAHDFTLTTSIARHMRASSNVRIHNANILPEQREYPEMTDRVRQAIKLCVIEGMPAHLAADEMGISLHTIRGYVKEGYRILEAYDHREYPVDMTPQERAFMRFTALVDYDD